MSQSSNGHPSEGSASSPAMCMSSSPSVVSSSPTPANSESVPNRISSMASETPSANSQYKGYEESHDDRLPAASSQMGMTDHGSRTYLSLGDDKLSGNVAIFGDRLHNLHDAINLVLERQNQEVNNPRSFVTDPVHWPDEAASAQHSAHSQSTPDHN
ncbi:hypothetical protein FOTG_02506 [Fusarium oxysporum f. sp. vasinfectum 25433]|uniref:Uncharacterized protein n=1 Tax=Fusarium oxysporum f. sp. vasinfectum 25433 TaxID=1089449 RepID=X0MKE6_FUSOX|nr:hypothetical protein FOTG_02506 [Fusarium oxysporum f. sp. vasinfectum 25433]